MFVISERRGERVLDRHDSTTERTSGGRNTTSAVAPVPSTSGACSSSRGRSGGRQTTTADSGSGATRRKYPHYWHDAKNDESVLRNVCKTALSPHILKVPTQGQPGEDLFQRQEWEVDRSKKYAAFALPALPELQGKQMEVADISFVRISFSRLKDSVAWMNAIMFVFNSLEIRGVERSCCGRRNRDPSDGVRRHQEGTCRCRRLALHLLEERREAECCSQDHPPPCARCGFLAACVLLPEVAGILLASRQAGKLR